MPCVEVEENWYKYFGDTPCDLLKVDIEGSEMDFLRNETGFLGRVRTIFIEWHKRQVSFEDLEEFLSSQNFLLK